ncbi:MAG: RDD family protein [Acidimicrobiales bacterium]|nr:RDD family protein [Acidimicrobiales bacterium]
MSPYRIVDPTDVLWRRTGAFCLDVAITTAIAAAVGLLIAWLTSAWMGVAAYLLSGLAWWLAISIGVQGRSGATPGKALCGLRVVDSTGRTIGTSQALTRTLAWPIDGFPYVVPATAFAASMSSRSGQRVGDRLARTRVVDKDFVGLPPVAVALPRDPEAGLEPYELRTFGDYLPAGMTITELKAARVRPDLPALVAGPLAPGATHRHDLPDTFEVPADPSEPRWDAERGAYVRWNAVHRTWMTFDETRREWVLPAGAAA